MKAWKILTGVAIGAGIAYLYNTEKGEDLRADIADSLKQLKKKMDRMAGNAATELADARKIMSKEIEGLSDEAREKIIELLDEGVEQAKKGKQAVNRMMA